MTLPAQAAEIAGFVSADAEALAAELGSSALAPAQLFISTAGDLAAELVNAIAEPSSAAGNKTSAILAELVAEPGVRTSAVIAEAREVIGGIEAAIDADLTGLVARHDDFIEATDAFIFDFLFDNDALLGLVSTDIEQSVGAQIVANLSGPIDLINALSPFPDIPGGEGRDLAEAIGAVAGEALGQVVNPAVGIVTDALKGFLGEFFEGALTDLEPLLEPLLKKLEDNPDVPPELLALLAPGFPALAPVMGAAMTFAVPLVVANALNVVLTPPLQKVLHEESKLIKWQLLSLDQAALAARRGHMSAERYADTGNRLGFADDDVVTMLAAQESLLNVVELSALWHREEIDVSVLDTELARLGFRPEDAARIKSLSFPIPAVQDLITMAVREVFSPEIAEAFGQFDEIPQVYLDWTAKQGLTEEWARNFWAAHWRLPSIFQGYEMLHRAVITDDELDRLFVAQDIMPFWRDRLKAISFNPVTRVDLRRLYRDGTITREQMHRGYLDIGYNERDADRLTSWTVDWAAAANATDEPESRGLTKSDVLKLFRRGVLNRVEATEFLTGMDFDEPSREALLNSIEIDKLLSARDEQIDFIVGRAKSGSIDFDTAQDELSDAGLSEEEIARSLIAVVRSKERATRLPTKKEILTWLAADQLTEDEARATFFELGYSRRWTDLYLDAGRAGELAELAEETDTELG